MSETCAHRLVQVQPKIVLWVLLFLILLEGILVSEISQTEKDKNCMISLICGI